MSELKQLVYPNLLRFEVEDESWFEELQEACEQRGIELLFDV